MCVMPYCCLSLRGFRTTRCADASMFEIEFYAKSEAVSISVLKVHCIRKMCNLSMYDVVMHLLQINMGLYNLNWSKFVT